MNLLLRRSRQHPLKRTRSLVEQAAEMDWDHLVISGDLTQLGLEREFELARRELEPLLRKPERVSIVPGNHDRYVFEESGRDGFKRLFEDYYGSEEVLERDLKNGWGLIGWDSCHPNPWWSASGTVRRSTLNATEELLQTRMQERPCVLVNHYPLTFQEGWIPDAQHELYNLDPVRRWVERHPQIRLYLHGHIHQNWIHRVKRPEGPDLMLVNSASSSQVLKRGQSSSFHQITIDGEKLEITPVRHRDDP